MTDFIDFERFERSPKPNNYLIAPDGLCANAKTDATSPDFEQAPNTVFQRLVALIEETPLWSDLKADESALRLSFVARTNLLRFKDDVDVKLLEGSAGAGAQIAIYSRSRIGHSDLGANKKRVSDILHKLTSN